MKQMTEKIIELTDTNRIEGEGLVSYNSFENACSCMKCLVIISDLLL